MLIHHNYLLSLDAAIRNTLSPLPQWICMCVCVCACPHVGVPALTSVDVCLITEALSISLQTVSYSITFPLHHWDWCVYAKSIMAQITCLRRREALVTFRLLAPSLEEGWDSLSETERQREACRDEGKKDFKKFSPLWPYTCLMLCHCYFLWHRLHIVKFLFVCF